MKTSLSFLGVAVVLCLALTLVNIWLIDKSIADLQFRQAVDPIAQELIAKVEGPDGWARVADFCGDFNEVDHFIVRPGGYAQCWRGGDEIWVKVWSALPISLENLLGTLQIKIDRGGRVGEIKHQRGT